MYKMPLRKNGEQTFFRFFQPNARWKVSTKFPVKLYDCYHRILLLQMDYKTADGKSLLDKVKKGVILNLLHDLDLTMQILQMLMSIGFQMTVNISSPSFVGFK